jgi:hypothetical protein
MFYLGCFYMNELQELKLIQTYKLNFSPIWYSFSEQKKHLWLSDGEQVVIFSLNKKEPVNKWLLPEVRWKHYLSELWHDNLVCSDWNGSIYAFSTETRGEGRTIHQAKYDSLPAYYLIAGPHGELLAATWNGQILIWHPNQADAQASFDLSNTYLPHHILLCLDGSLFITDQESNLCLLDDTGQEIWHDKIEGNINEVWIDKTDVEQRAFFVLVDKQTIIHVNTKNNNKQAIHFDHKIVSLSHLATTADEFWTVLALENQTVEWLSWFPFRLSRHDRIGLGFRARQILAIFDRQQPNIRIALGLNNMSQLFTVRNQKVQVFDTPSIDKLLPAHSGHLMLWLLSDKVYVYLNPVTEPLECQMEVAEILGDLVVGEYHELVVNLKNTGQVTIAKAKAQLTGLGRIFEPESLSKTDTILPGKTINLSFSVKAIEAGPRVPLKLELELEDETGLLVDIIHLDIQVRSGLGFEHVPIQNHLSKLHKLIVEHFDRGELRSLCFELNIDYDVLPGDDGKANKVRELLVYLDRRERIPELLQICRRDRPKLAWYDYK